MSLRPDTTTGLERFSFSDVTLVPVASPRAVDLKAPAPTPRGWGCSCLECAMRTSERSPDLVAEVKFRIVQQQELAARLVRAGDADGARQARAKLIMLVNKLDVLEHMLRPLRNDKARAS